MVNDTWKLFELAVLTKNPLQFNLYSLYRATMEQDMIKEEDILTK